MLPSVLSKISTSESSITDWQTQIAELQSRIVAEQQRINRLNEDNAVADGLLQAAQDAKGKISDSEVIADLLAQLSRLFSGDNNPNSGNRFHPNPEPQPGGDEGCNEVSVVKAGSKTDPIAIQPEPLTQTGKRADAIATEVAIAVTAPESEEIGGVEETITSTPTESEEIKEVVRHDAVEPQPEPNLGQSCEWASPLATPHSVLLATPLCCHLEDAPQSALQGQAVDLAQIAYSRDGFKYIDYAIAVETSTTPDTPKEPDYFELIPVSDTVAYFRNNKTGEIAATYVGFNSKSKAEKWGKFLTVDYTIASGFELRDAKRLSAFNYEIKLWGLSLSQIQKLAESDQKKAPHNSYGNTSKRKPEPVAVPKPLQVDDIEVGDTVRSTTVKNWHYKVLEIEANGLFKCEQINTSDGIPLKVSMHPASVELVSRAIKVADSETSQHITIDVNDVPPGVELKQTDDRLLREYRVWIWCVARVKGKPELQQKCIGSLVETQDGIAAHRPHGLSNAQSFKCTLDAVKHLVQSSGFKLSEIESAYKQHRSEVGNAHTPAITPERACASLFGVGYDVPAPQQQIESGDWVELLVNGDRYQVAEVDSEGIHLVTDDGNMLVQPGEVQLLMKIPADWQPF